METEEFNTYFLHYLLSEVLIDIRGNAALDSIDTRKTYLITHIVHNLPSKLFLLKYKKWKKTSTEMVSEIERRAIHFNLQEWFSDTKRNGWLVYNEMKNNPHV